MSDINRNVALVSLAAASFVILLNGVPFAMFVRRLIRQRTVQ
jgi:hypothetical protein